MNPTPMPKDISCENFKGLFAYIRRHYGDHGIRMLTHGLINGDYFVRDKFEPTRVIPISDEHLNDPAYWVSNNFSLILLANVKKVVKGPNPLYTAGMGMVQESLSKTILFVAKFVGVGMLAKKAEKINARFNKTKDVCLIESTDSGAIFELNYRTGFKVTKDVCNWNLGIYTGIARLAGVADVRSQETACVLDGAPHCRIQVTWKKRSVIRRVLKSLSNAVIRWSIKDLIADYEKTLEERDNLIEKLVYSESKYRTLFEDSLIPINICQDGKLREANPAWLKLHGYSDKAEVLGKDILDFVHPEDRPYMASRRQKWTDNRMRIVQIRDITRQGKVIDVEVYSSRIEYDETVATLSTLRDISALKKAENKRKQLETRIQRAEKMEAIATLAGGVAHDLNNILSGIVGYPDLILMQLPDQSPLHEPVRSMQDSGKKAAAIVQDLLTLARRGVMSAEILNLNQVVTDFLASPECIKMLSDHPGVAITHSLQPDLFNVKGSMAHLSKTVMNLLTNAAEAMPDGGEIRIETLNLAIDGTMQGFDAIPQGEYCVLVIADNGIGISETDKEKIFEPFYTKKKMGRSGTGLGMAVVWGTVKDHGGFVQLESAVNEGTTIKLFFPATHADQLAEHAAPELAGLKGRGEKILVVDDVQEQRDLAESMLTHMGYRVKTVASGEAAVDYITHCACDLVLLDMIMDPGIDGLATYREILKQRPGQKAVIMSGYSATDRVKALLKLGADTYIKKPYTLEQLGTCIRETLDKPHPTPAD